MGIIAPTLEQRLPIPPGTRVGAYEIVALIGSGGMGEVYRARDRKLGRDVALKILPVIFAADPERLARFEREAKMLAALNHPHIAQIYGFENDGSVHALAMEFVGGDDLAQRIARGPIPLDEALPIARQTAEALEAAHELGIVHRDLKPANIKLRPDGTVKVLDFGLAKALGQESGIESQSGADYTPVPNISATVTRPATIAGMILGTAAYMSPEQAKGKPVDKRTDIWAFGCVLYELLTDRPLFAAETTSETIAAVIRADIDLTGLPPDTPPRLRALLERCLERDPRRRLRDIGEARVMLEGPPDRPVAAIEPVRSSARRGLLPWALAVLGLALGAAGAMLLRSPGSERSVISSVALAPGETFYLAGANPGPVVVSPDGSRLAFTVSQKGDVSLWIRELNARTARRIPGTESAQYPFWSADSRSVAFFARRKLKKVDVSGGLPVDLADVVDGKGGSWSADGTILFAPDSDSAIFRVASSGGQAAAVTTLRKEAGENSHRFPSFLPDGQHFLYLTRRATDSNAARRDGIIRVGSIDQGVDRELTASESHAVYVSGRVLHVLPRTSTLVARPFNARTLTWEGDPDPLAEDVLVLGGGMRGVFDASSDILTYFPSDGRALQQLVWFSRSGARETALTDIGDYSFRLSSDGQRVIFQEVGGGGAEDLWLLDVRHGMRTRFTRDPASDNSPVWSPDGRGVIFTSSRRGRLDIYWKSPERDDQEVALLVNDQDKFVSDWSADGRFVLFHLTAGDDPGIWMLPLEGTSPPKPRDPVRVVHSGGYDWDAAFSPDGRWLSYASRDSAIDEVFLARVPGGDGKRQVSRGGGAHPRWRADGRELYYLTPRGEVVAVPIAQVGDSLEVGSPTTLFATGRTLDQYPPFEVTRDGQRFLVLAPRAEATTPMLTLITNWTRVTASGER